MREWDGNYTDEAYDCNLTHPMRAIEFLGQLSGAVYVIELEKKAGKRDQNGYWMGDNPPYQELDAGSQGLVRVDGDGKWVAIGHRDKLGYWRTHATRNSDGSWDWKK